MAHQEAEAVIAVAQLEAEEAVTVEEVAIVVAQAEVVEAAIVAVHQEVAEVAIVEALQDRVVLLVEEAQVEEEDNSIKIEIS